MTSRHCAPALTPATLTPPGRLAERGDSPRREQRRRRGGRGRCRRPDHLVPPTLLHARNLRPGQHLTTLGADEPGKIELSADLLRTACVIVDDVVLAAQSGALGNAGLDAAPLPAHSLTSFKARSPSPTARKRSRTCRTTSTVIHGG
ncbi:hypothetical protein ACQP2F_17950 [Actinoplanes sp. CA-030573]|uniref:hypothetical protein n=1 Tax=Actinoplanes sp. CA-030573 TaxID=3239898 RepID=UPI003D949C79